MAPALFPRQAVFVSISSQIRRLLEVRPMPYAPRCRFNPVLVACPPESAKSAAAVPAFLACFLFLSGLMTLVSGCAKMMEEHRKASPKYRAEAMRQSLSPAGQAALALAEGLNFAGRGVSDEPAVIASPCVVIPEGPSLFLDKINGVSAKESGLPGKKIGFFPPGRQTFTAVNNTSVRSANFSRSSSGGISPNISYSTNTRVIKGSYLFESGKHYKMILNVGWTSAELVIEEITDPQELAKIEGYLTEYVAETAKRKIEAKENRAKLAKYLAFSKRHPKFLEGKWTNPEGDVFEFSGGKADFTTRGNIFSNRDRYSGEFIFDDSTIYIYWKDYTLLHKTKGEFKAQNIEELPNGLSLKTVLAYNISGDTLNITYSLNNYLFFPGTYKRVN
jgi:hypothetical protein